MPFHDITELPAGLCDPESVSAEALSVVIASITELLHRIYLCEAESQCLGGDTDRGLYQRTSIVWTRMRANSFIQWLRIIAGFDGNSTSLSELNYLQSRQRCCRVGYLLVTQLFLLHHATSCPMKQWMQLCLASLVMVSSIVGFAKTVSGIYDIGFINRCRLIQHSCQIVGSARLHKPHRHRLSCQSQKITHLNPIALHITGDKIMAKIVRFHEAGDAGFPKLKTLYRVRADGAYQK